MLQIKDHLIQTIKNNHTKEEQEKAIEKKKIAVEAYGSGTTGYRIKNGPNKGKIVARESIKGFSKDVLTKIHGGGAGDRKKKLLKKQKKEKARSKQFGRVEIPQEAFIGVLKISKET